MRLPIGGIVAAAAAGPSQCSVCITSASATTDRETNGAADFDAALEGYTQGGNPEELLQAAGKVIECHLRIDPKHADTISGLTDNLDIEIETYADAADAIRRWFASHQHRC